LRANADLLRRMGIPGLSLSCDRWRIYDLPFQMFAVTEAEFQSGDKSPHSKLN
jgi:hypothetical protein